MKSLLLAAHAVLSVRADSPPSGVTISTDGRCGAQFGDTVCPGDQCCSKYGWCGTGPEWCSCAAGCSEQFGGKCGWPVENKPWGQHYCSVPDNLDGQFKSLFPEVQHDSSADHDMGSDIKKLVRGLDRGVNPISVEMLYNIASTAKQSFPNLSWIEFSQSLLELHNFFPDTEPEICRAVENIANTFNHPTFSAIARDLVIMQTATKEDLTLASIVQQVDQLKEFASRSDTSAKVREMDDLAEAVAALGRAFDHFNLHDLVEFMRLLDQRYFGVTFSELAESLASLKDMASNLTLMQIGDQLDRFAQDWGNTPPLQKLPLDMLCDTLTTLHYSYGTHTDLGGALTSIMTLKRTFDADSSLMQQATLPWIKKEMLRLQHGTPAVPDTLLDVTNSIVAIKTELYSNTQQVSLPQIVEYILIMYQNFGKQEPSLKSLIDQAKEAGKTFQKYNTGSIPDDPFFDAHALAQFANHFARSQVLPLAEVVKTFEALHKRFDQSTIPAMCRDLITMQYSNDNLGTIVNWVEKVYDNNKQKWTALPDLNFDDVASGMKALQSEGTFVQNCERYMSSNQPFHEFVKSALDKLQQGMNGAQTNYNPSWVTSNQNTGTVNNYNGNRDSGSVGSVTAEKNTYQRPEATPTRSNTYNNFDSYNPPQQPYVVPGSEAYEYGKVEHNTGHSWFFYFFLMAVLAGAYYFWPVIVAQYNHHKFKGTFDNFKYDNLGFEMPPVYGGMTNFADGGNDDFDL